MYCSGYQVDTTFLIFSSAEFLPRILYYSHIPAMFLSLFMGFFVYFKSGKVLLGKILLIICLVLSIILIADLIIWVANKSEMVIFFWALFYLFSIGLNFLFVYLFKVFIKKKDISSRDKLIFFLLILPIVIVLPTNYYLQFFDVQTCNAHENGFIVSYGYFLSIITIIWLIILAITGYKKESDLILKKQIIIFFSGINLFLIPLLLLGFTATYLVYSGSEANYTLEPYGYLGIYFFIGVVMYLIVKYKLFGIKIHEGQVIIIALCVLVGAQLFYIKQSTDQIIIAITFLITIFFGWQLIRSIRKEEQRKRRKLEQVNEELRKLDETKSEFINIASHQLRTPITVIRGVISLMKSGKIDQLSEEEKKQFITSAWEKGCKLEEIIKDILNAAALTNKKYIVAREMVEDIALDRLVFQIVNDFRSESERTEIKLSFKKEGTSFLIQGIREDLREVFNNLLDNAFKYTFPLNGVIDVYIQEKENIILVSIKDNGIGIPEKEVTRLFEKFYRASNAKKMYTDGSGLGLFIVHEIVEGHKGETWVKSQLDHGTTFFVSLPKR